MTLEELKADMEQRVEQGYIGSLCSPQEVLALIAIIEEMAELLKAECFDPDEIITRHLEKYELIHRCKFQREPYDAEKDIT